MNITVAKANYYVIHKGDIFAMFLGRSYARRSQLAVHYIWKEGDVYQIYSPLRNKIKDHYVGTRGNSTDSTSFMLYACTLGEFKQDGLNTSILQNLDAKGLIKRMKTLDQEDFVTWLRTDKGQTLEEVKTKFGIEAGSEEDIVEYQGAKILFSSSVKDKKKQDIMGYLETVYNTLNAHQLGYVFAGDIVIAPLANSVAGWYFSQSKEMHIDPNATKSVIEVLFHEYAHKLFHLHLNHKQKSMIKLKYSEEIRNTDTKKDKIKYYKNILHPGQKVYYINGKFTQYYDRILKIKTLGPTFLNVDTGLSTLTIPYDMIPEQIMLEDGTRIKPFVSQKSSKLFPSEYSKTNSEEWFAECFAYYLMDKASPEINTFMKELLSTQAD